MAAANLIYIKIKQKNLDKDLDVQPYRNRHIIKNLFAKRKQYKANATLADKLARSFNDRLTYVCTFFMI